MRRSRFKYKKPKESIGFAFWQTTISWQKLIKKKIDHYNLSHAQFVIMAILLWCDEQEKTSTQADIVKLSKLDKMTVSKALKKLVYLSYINRNENDLDTRVKDVSLTEEGKVIIQKLMPQIDEVDDKFFTIFDEQEKKLFLELLSRLS